MRKRQLGLPHSKGKTVILGDLSESTNGPG